MSKTEQFKAITEKMAEVYEAKNHDYGDSFAKSFDAFGPVAGVVRMADKMNRLETLTKTWDKKTQTVQGLCVKDESIKDTLLDIANYAVMFLIELENTKAERIAAVRKNMV